MIEKDIEKFNKEALEKVSLAQDILNKLQDNPGLSHYHDSVLSGLGDSRHNKDFVYDNLYEFMIMYNTMPDKMPEQVQKFIKEANKFFYGRGN